MLSYITHRRRSQQRIHERMRQHIRVRVSQQVLFIRDGHASQYHARRAVRLIIDQSVDIISVPYPHLYISRLSDMQEEGDPAASLPISATYAGYRFL